MSVLSIDFKPEGKLFQIMDPEYVMLCLKISRSVSTMVGNDSLVGNT